MDANHLKQLLESVRSGSVDVDAALDRLRHMPFEDLGFAKVDHHRALRQGNPEVIFGQGKTPEQIVEIAARLSDRNPNVLITRTAEDAAARLLARFPTAEHFPASRVVRIWGDRAQTGKGKIIVACAGTSDIPVAEEAQLTAQTMGNDVETIFDVGVAGCVVNLKPDTMPFGPFA